MEELLIGLLIIAIVAIPVLLIILLVWTNALARRVRDLEYALHSVQTRPAEGPSAQESEPTPPATEPQTSPSSPETGAEQTGPWQAPGREPPTSAPATPQAAASAPPRAVVLRAEKARALGDWLKANWIYAVSAISLAFAGIFFVQYGIETGLLTPPARVAAALVFGAILVAAGEYIRRRWGDRDDVSTAYIPSVFSGAGIVTLFGAVLAALHLYALIGPGVAFAGLVAVAALAVGLGWYSGPLLAAIGIAGSFAAPFLVGGESETPWVFYGYFALIAAVGLAIDAGRRWAWVSVVTLALAYPAGWLLYAGAGYPEAFAALMVWLVTAATAIPPLKLWPRHDGASVIESFAKGRPRGWPQFPTRLVAGSMAASVAGLGWLALGGTAEFWLAATALTVLAGAIALWAARAEALADVAALPALALLAFPPAAIALDLSPYLDFRAWLGAEEGTPVPNAPYFLVGLGLALSLMAAWRSHFGARWPVAWGAAAALAAPLMVAGLEFAWRPRDVLGAYPWALVVIGVAAVMVALALVFARSDGETRPRVAGFALAALALIALAMALIFTKMALTLAFAVLTLGAAALDRRFGLRPLSVAVQVGAIALGWRLVLDPGVDWALGAPMWEVALSFVGALAALAASLVVLKPLGRPLATIVAESAAWTLAAVFASVLLHRTIEANLPDARFSTHWSLGLHALIWFSSAAAQLWRMQAGGPMRLVRAGLAGLFGLIAIYLFGLAATTFNPVATYSVANLVRGPAVLNTLLPAYLLPALPALFVAWRFGFLDIRLRRALGAAAALALALWLFLAIRHIWRGAAMAAPGFTDPELYSYTIALLVIGAGLLYQAIARRSAGLRKLAMGVIALTIAKVFLVDISGLVGLLRVFSFLALGLALAGLAFLNRWAAGRIAEGKEEAEA